MTAEYRYKAFISYRHTGLDKKAADKLQKMLENYKPPKDMEKRNNWKVFRDETELTSSNNLSEDIKHALNTSEFLIVICSETTALSKWCMEEIDYFKSLHNNTTENIITLVVSGNPDEVFPESLCKTLVPVTDGDGIVSYREEIVEPLAANINAPTEQKSLKLLNSEFLRIAAPLMGCGYDDLYKRERRRTRRRRTLEIAAAFGIVSLFAITSMVLLLQTAKANENLDRSNNNLTAAKAELEEKNVALKETNKNLDSALNDVTETNKKLDESNASLEESNSNLEKSKANLEKSNASLEKKTKEAEDNLKTAEKNLAYAQTQEAEATKQANIARQQEAYAKAQEAEAIENARRATEERKKAEAAQKAAEKAQAAAEENLKKLQYNSAELAAGSAENLFDSDYNRISAITTALADRPYVDYPDVLLPRTQNDLTQMLYLYKTNALMRLDRLLQADSYIDSFSVNSDGKYIAAYDKMKNVYIWDTENGNIVYRKNENYIYTMDFAGNDSIIIATDRGVEKYNFKENRTEWTKDVDVYGGIFSDDKTKMAFWDRDINVYFIDTETGDKICESHVSSIGGFQQNFADFHDGTHFAAAIYYLKEKQNPYNFTIYSIDLQSNTVSQPYNTNNLVRSVYCTKSGLTVVEECESKNENIKIIDKDGNTVHKVKLNENSIFSEANILCCASHESDEYVFVAVKNTLDLTSCVYMVNINTGKVEKTFPVSEMAKEIYVYEGDLVIHTADGKVYVYDWANYFLGEYIVNSDTAEKLIYKKDLPVAAMIGSDRSQIVIYRYTYDTNYTPVEIGDFMYWELKPIGEYIAGRHGSYYEQEHYIQLINTRSKEITDDIKIPTPNFKYDRYKDQLAVLEQESGILHLYNLSDGSEVLPPIDFATLTGEKNTSWCLAAAENGNKLIVFSTSGAVCTLDESGANYLGNTEGTLGYKQYTASPDGRHLITEGTSYIYQTGSVTYLMDIDTETGDISILSEKTGDMSYTSDTDVLISFSNDSQKAAIVLDGKPKIYDLNTHKLIKEVPESRDTYSIKFEPNDEKIILCTTDYMLYEYEANTGIQINKLRLNTLNNTNVNSSNVNIAISKTNNEVIVSHGNYACFVDLDSFEIVAEATDELYVYAGFSEDTQEVITYGVDEAGEIFSLLFYPYRSSKDLIEMADEVIAQ